jgi:hypothetical protein
VATAAEIADLRTKLAEAREALHKLMLGDKETQVGFGTNRLTQWAQANPDKLRAYISELEGKLAAATGDAAQSRRGPIYPMGETR